MSEETEKKDEPLTASQQIRIIALQQAREDYKDSDTIPRDSQVTHRARAYADFIHRGW